MREVQFTCGQCGQTSGYLEPEPSDYTSIPGGVIFHQPWKCCHCGYPEIFWTEHGFQYRPQEIRMAKMRITDEDGNTIKV